MIRYLNYGEIELLRKNLKFYKKLKLLAYKTSNDIDKFYNLELPLDKAIEIYINLIDIHYMNYSNTDKIDNVMKDYLSKIDPNYEEFLNKAIKEKYAHRYTDETVDDNMDEYLEEYCDTTHFIYEFMTTMLGNPMDIADAYELVFHYYEKDIFDDERRELWDTHRSYVVSEVGLDEYDDENIIDQFEYHSIIDNLRTECTTIAIADVNNFDEKGKISYAFTKLLYCTKYSRPFSEGGLYSSFYINKDYNLFLDITSEDCPDLALGIFNIIAIIVYKIRKEKSNEKNDYRGIK